MLKPRIDPQLLTFFNKSNISTDGLKCSIRTNVPNELEEIPASMVEIIKLKNKNANKFK